MKLDRKEVALAQAQFYRLGQDMLAELCKAWLALDAAPVAMILTKDVDGDWVLASDGVTGTLAEIDAMLGQRVRLVATSGGE